MADFDTAVREALHAAVPPDLEAEPFMLIDGAVRTARRTRRLQRAGAGLVALAFAVLAGAAGWVGLHRASPSLPARNPVTQQLCRHPHPTSPPVRPVRGLTGDAAAICPVGDVDGPGWELPGAPITLQRWVAYLREGIAAPPQAGCPEGVTAGPPFVVVIQRVDGGRTAYRSADLACRGREAVARYLQALAYQRADQQAATTSGYALHCSPPQNHAVAPGVSAPMASIRVAHSTGLICVYPVFDPLRPGKLQTRDYHAVPLTGHQLTALHQALRTGTFTTAPPAACAPSTSQVLLRLTTPGDHGPAGEHVDFTGTCMSVLRLDGYSLWWQPDPATQALLAQALPAS